MSVSTKASGEEAHLNKNCCFKEGCSNSKFMVWSSCRSTSGQFLLPCFYFGSFRKLHEPYHRRDEGQHGGLDGFSCQPNALLKPWNPEPGDPTDGNPYRNYGSLKLGSCQLDSKSP